LKFDERSSIGPAIFSSRIAKRSKVATADARVGVLVIVTLNFLPGFASRLMNASPDFEPHNVSEPGTPFNSKTLNDTLYDPQSRNIPNELTPQVTN
jgi:hypothetical protein